MFITANSSADEENIDDLGKVSKKKSRKKSGDSPNSIFEEKNYFFFMMMMTNLHCNPKAFFTSEFILWRALSIQTDPYQALFFFGRTSFLVKSIGRQSKQ